MNWLALFMFAAAPDVPRDAPGLWAEPARGVFLTPGARPLLTGLNAASLDGLPPDDTAHWFDGVRLRIPAHALLGPSTLHPAWLRGVHVGAAVDSVGRGRALGSAIELLSREVSDEDFHGVARVDILQTGVWAGGVIPGAGTRIAAAGRFFAIPAVAASFFGITALLGDYQLRVEQPLGEGSLRLLALGAIDSVALSVSGIPVAARVQGHQVDLRWKSAQEDGLELGLEAAWEGIGLSLRGAQTQNHFDGVEQSFGARALFHHRPTDWLRLGVGGDVSVRRLLLDQRVVTGTPPVDSVDTNRVTVGGARPLGHALLSGAFVNARVNVGTWNIEGGARVDGWRATDSSVRGTVDPRLTVEGRVAQDWSLRFGAGLAHQAPSWLFPIPALSTAALRYGVQEAFKGEAQVAWQVNPSHGLTLRGFGTALTRAIELSPFDDNFLQELNLVDADVKRRTVNGYAAGGEVSWTFVENDFAWLMASYSFQVSARQLTFARVGDDALPTTQATAMVPWAYQRSHAARAGGGIAFGEGWSLSAAATLLSGPPQAGGLYAQEQRTGVDSLTGAPRWVAVDRDRVSPAGPWVRLDARASKTWKPAPAEIELFLDVQTLSYFNETTGTSYNSAGGALTQGRAGSPLPGPLPILGLELRL